MTGKEAVQKKLDEAEKEREKAREAQKKAADKTKAAQKEVDRLKKAVKREAEKEERKKAAEQKRQTEREWLDLCYKAKALPAMNPEQYTDLLTEFFAKVADNDNGQTAETAGEGEGGVPLTAIELVY